MFSFISCVFCISLFPRVRTSMIICCDERNTEFIVVIQLQKQYGAYGKICMFFSVSFIFWSSIVLLLSSQSGSFPIRKLEFSPQKNFSNLTEYLLECAAKDEAVWHDKPSTCVCLLPWECCEGRLHHKVWDHLDICGCLCLDLFKSSILRQWTESLFQIKV